MLAPALPFVFVVAFWPALTLWLGSGGAPVLSDAFLAQATWWHYAMTPVHLFVGFGWLTWLWHRIGQDWRD